MIGHLGALLVWGFGATVVLTALIGGSQALGFTRMSLPFVLGTMFTANRDRADLIGVLVHFVNGWLFAFVYFAAFASVGHGGWWLGAAIGLVHGAFVLAVGLPLLPAVHPRMASEQHGPTARRQLEPPGALGLNYGRRTPVIVLAAHVVYGAILGALYR